LLNSSTSAGIIFAKFRYRTAVTLLFAVETLGKVEMTTPSRIDYGHQPAGPLPHLTEFLLGKDTRCMASCARQLVQTPSVRPLYHDPHVAGPRLAFHYGDLSDRTVAAPRPRKVQPQEVYNLPPRRATSGVVRIPEYNRRHRRALVYGLCACLRALRDYMDTTALRCAITNRAPRSVRRAFPPPQKRDDPVSILAAPTRSASCRAWYVVITRSYGCSAAIASSSIHESPAAERTFVTRKITRARRAHQGKGCRRSSFLGNLDARRDWSFGRRLRRGDFCLCSQQDASRRLLSPPGGFLQRTGFRRRPPSLRLGLEWSNSSISIHPVSAAQPMSLPAGYSSKARAYSVGSRASTSSSWSDDGRPATSISSRARKRP